MRTKMLWLILFVASFSITGCKSTNEFSSIESKTARMSPELLRSQVLRYKALIEEDCLEEKLSAINYIFNTLAPQDTPFTAETSKSISKAMEENPEIKEWNLRHQENLKKYKFFYKKLQEKGGDMRGLGLDPSYDRKNIFDYEEYLPPNQEFQKPVSPPIEKKSDPLWGLSYPN